MQQKRQQLEETMGICFKKYLLCTELKCSSSIKLIIIWCTRKMRLKWLLQVNYNT